MAPVIHAARFEVMKRRGVPRVSAQPATPASVGRRLGRWRWPVVAVVLLLLLLLGALAANKLTGASAPGIPEHLVAGQDGRFRIVTDTADRWME